MPAAFGGLEEEDSSAAEGEGGVGHQESCFRESGKAAASVARREVAAGLYFPQNGSALVGALIVCFAVGLVDNKHRHKRHLRMIQMTAAPKVVAPMLVMTLQLL
mmetsp:Transcript_10665/g.17400  ORF Transcript_10665/g.17400 Transcript_10665/m.17400 type:complete len:104 (-) Transcript_10665:180-491(-)